jgi:hypothetical protein
VQNGGDFSGFRIIFQYENDGGLGPWFMDQWRLGPPWTTRRRGLEATRARRHARRSSVSDRSRARNSPARVACGEGRTVKPVRRSPRLIRRRGGQAAMANRQW